MRKPLINKVVILIISLFLSCSNDKISVDIEGLNMENGLRNDITISEIITGDDGRLPHFEKYSLEVQLKLDYDSIVYLHETDRKIHYKDHEVFEYGDRILFNSKNKGYYWLYKGVKLDTLPFSIKTNTWYYINGLEIENRPYYMYFYVKKDSVVQYELKPVILSPI